MGGFWQTIPSLLLATFALAQCTASDSSPDHQSGKPRIQLMTSLPLVWGEGASMQSILAGGADPAPIYRYWQSHYDIMAVDSLENLAEQDPDIVILAQPRAMDPADLSDLDDWVRAGGAVIILTDPELVWPSALPLGDPQRPLASGLLSPLLAHWGLELVADGDNKAGFVDIRTGGFSFITKGAGKFERISDKAAPDVRCKLGADDFIVRCRVGQGHAIMVADADFLHAALWPESARLTPGKSDAVRFVDSLVLGHFDPDDLRK